MFLMVQGFISLSRSWKWRHETKSKNAIYRLNLNPEVFRKILVLNLTCR